MRCYNLCTALEAEDVEQQQILLIGASSKRGKIVGQARMMIYVFTHVKGPIKIGIVKIITIFLS
jgi:hypothetical protein